MSTELAVAGKGSSFALPELQLIAKNVAQSRLFAGIENEQAAFTLMLICQAEGLHPIDALRRYHVIKGRPSMRADAMQAEFQRQGGIIRWGVSDAKECTARFVHPVHAPDPGVTIVMTMKEAVETGLTSSDMYRKFPAQMLRARVISQGVRMVLPGVVVGIYTPEEVDQVEVYDVTPAAPPAPTREALDRPAIETPTRSSVNEAFKPAGDPGSSREKVKLPGDRPNAKGLDGRRWFDLVEQVTAAAVEAATKHRARAGVDGDPEFNAIRIARHLVKSAVAAGADGDPEAPGPDGKPARVGVGKLGAYLVELYRDEAWRDWLRAELRRYLGQLVMEDADKVDQLASGGAVPVEDQSPEVAAEDQSQMVPAGEIEPEAGWAPGRE